MQVAADSDHSVIHVDSTPPTTSGWLCHEEPVQVRRGSVTIRPRPPTTNSHTIRLGCGTDTSVRRVLMFNVTATDGRSDVSLTLDSLLVEGAILGGL